MCVCVCVCVSDATHTRSPLQLQEEDAQHANLARAIFDELNDAFARFEESGSQALY